MLCCGGGEEEPVPLSDQRTQAEELRGRLSTFIQPLDVDFASADATVNLSSLPSGRLGGRPSTPLGAFERRQSMRQEASPLASPPGTAGGAPGGGGLQWTESRKLLEAAIGMEQMQSIPEDASSRDGGVWGPGLQAAEARLTSRLFKLKLEHCVMEGDGNCQFRSVSFGLYGTPRHHAYVRRRAVKYMRQQRHEFEAFLGEEFSSYAKQMARGGTWGDELTLRAACEALAVVVNVVSSDDANWFLRYLPRTCRPQHEIFVTYIAPLHYNAIRRQHTGDRLRRSFGRQHSQLARAVSTYTKAYGLPDSPQHVVAAGLAS